MNEAQHIACGAGEYYLGVVTETEVGLVIYDLYFSTKRAAIKEEDYLMGAAANYRQGITKEVWYTIQMGRGSQVRLRRDHIIGTVIK